MSLWVCDVITSFSQTNPNHVCVCLYVCACVCMCVCVCLSACLSVFLCVGAAMYVCEDD